MFSLAVTELLRRRAAWLATAGVTATADFPPGYIIPGEPIYTLPPEELQPEISIRADLLAESRDWSHENLGIASLFASGFRGAGVLVSVCDTGVSYEHPDLRQRVKLQLCKDFTGSTYGYADRQGHGSHCSGIVAASSDGSGIVGIAPEADLMHAKVLGDTGSGASSWIARGIRYSADSGADIISLSLGGPSPDSETRAAIQYAASKGCWIVAAAGNDGGPASGYPGHYPETIAVAATDRNNARASFSTINQQNDIAAPGVSIMSTLPNGRYGSMSGTSMACPAVAGCLAIVRGALKRTGQRMPNQAEIMAAMKATARDIPPTGGDSHTGAGLIDTQKLLNNLLSPSPVPPPDGGIPAPGGSFRLMVEVDPSNKTIRQVG